MEQKSENENAPTNGNNEGTHNEQTDEETPVLELKDEDRKLFVGGLSWETTEKELRDYFTKYGEIEGVNVKTDTATGRSRGFAFIIFKKADTLDAILSEEHIINNKKVDPKKAKMRPGKIFVGGLTPEITEEDIRKYFGKFGKIVAVEMPFDKEKNQRKAFCFVTYEAEHMASEAILIPKQVLKGKAVDVKRATQRPGEYLPGMRGRGGGPGRGRGMGRGYYPPYYDPYYAYYDPYTYGYYYDPYYSYYDYGAYYGDPATYGEGAAAMEAAPGAAGRGKLAIGKQRGGATSKPKRPAPY